jgi:hypothetical protein
MEWNAESLAADRPGKTLDQLNYLSDRQYRAFWDVYGEALHDTHDIEGMVVAREIAFQCFPELVGHPPPEALVEPGNEVFLTPPVLVIRGFDPETHPDFDPENESVPQSYTAGGTFYKRMSPRRHSCPVDLSG